MSETSSMIGVMQLTGDLIIQQWICHFSVVVNPWTVCMDYSDIQGVLFNEFCSTFELLRTACSFSGVIFIHWLSDSESIKHVVVQIRLNLVLRSKNYWVKSQVVLLFNCSACFAQISNEMTSDIHYSWSGDQQKKLILVFSNFVMQCISTTSKMICK